MIVWFVSLPDAGLGDDNLSGGDIGPDVLAGGC